jgi:hypothetical protein
MVVFDLSYIVVGPLVRFDDGLILKEKCVRPEKEENEPVALLSP